VRCLVTGRIVLGTRGEGEALVVEAAAGGALSVVGKLEWTVRPSGGMMVVAERADRWKSLR